MQELCSSWTLSNNITHDVTKREIWWPISDYNPTSTNPPKVPTKKINQKVPIELLYKKLIVKTIKSNMSHMTMGGAGNQCLKTHCSNIHFFLFSFFMGHWSKVRVELHCKVRQVRIEYPPGDKIAFAGKSTPPCPHPEPQSQFHQCFTTSIFHMNLQVQFILTTQE